MPCIINKRICRQTERSSEFSQKRNEKLKIIQSERVASLCQRRTGAGGRNGGLGVSARPANPSTSLRTGFG